MTGLVARRRDRIARGECAPDPVGCPGSSCRPDGRDPAGPHPTGAGVLAERFELLRDLGDPSIPGTSCVSADLLVPGAPGGGPAALSWPRRSGAAAWRCRATMSRDEGEAQAGRHSWPSFHVRRQLLGAGRRALLARILPACFVVPSRELTGPPSSTRRLHGLVRAAHPIVPNKCGPLDDHHHHGAIECTMRDLMSSRHIRARLAGLARSGHHYDGPWMRPRARPSFCRVEAVLGARRHKGRPARIHVSRSTRPLLRGR